MERFFLFILVHLTCCGLLISKNKVAYVDLEYVFQTSSLKKESDNKTKLQKQTYIELQNNLKTSLSKIKKELRQLERMLGHAEYMKIFKKRKNKINIQKKELLNLKKEYKEWYRIAQVSLFEELVIAIETISEKEEVDLVLSKRPAVLYSEDSLDISDKVINFVNQINQRESITVK